MNDPRRSPLDPLTQNASALLMAVRQALLMVVDALEVYLGFSAESRTAALRKRNKQP